MLAFKHMQACGVKSALMLALKATTQRLTNGVNGRVDVQLCETGSPVFMGGVLSPELSVADLTSTAFASSFRSRWTSYLVTVSLCADAVILVLLVRNTSERSRGPRTPHRQSGPGLNLRGDRQMSDALKNAAKLWFRRQTQSSIRVQEGEPFSHAGLRLQQTSELFLAKPSVTDDATHREGVDRIVARDRKNAARSGRHFYFSDGGILEEFIANGEVLLDSGLYVPESFFLCSDLRPAARKSGNGNAESFFALLQCNLVLHRWTTFDHDSRSGPFNGLAPLGRPVS